MYKNLNIKGIKEYSIEDFKIWNNILDVSKNIIKSYGYNEIYIPIINNYNYFLKAFNEKNEINKQIYKFKDKKNNYLILRPEGTLICLKFIINNGLFKNKKNKLWYFGPMFRYENPQLGRYREFYQLGLEVFGYKNLGIEIELFLIFNKIINELNLNKYIFLEINFIGNNYILNKYKYNLINFININKNIFDCETLNILNSNPLKFLDDIILNKYKFLIKKIPKIINLLNNEDKNKINYIKYLLKSNNIKYKYNNFLFRGLNYYDNLIFEWKTRFLEKKISICSGGNYNKLLFNIYKNKLDNFNNYPLIGQAIGWNRLFLLKKKYYINNKKNSYIYFTLLNSNYLKFICIFSEKLRCIFPKIKLLVDYSISNLNNKINFIIKNKINISFIIKKILVNKKEIIYKNIEKNIYLIIQNENDIIDILKNKK